MSPSCLLSPLPFPLSVLSRDPRTHGLWGASIVPLPSTPTFLDAAGKSLNCPFTLHSPAIARSSPCPLSPVPRHGWGGGGLHHGLVVFSLFHSHFSDVSPTIDTLLLLFNHCQLAVTFLHRCLLKCLASVFQSPLSHQFEFL